MIDAAELRRLVEQWQLAFARRPAFGIDGDKKAEAFYQTAEHQLLHFVTSHASELLALVEADVWRPIESAPTKGWQTYSSPEILGVDERGTQRVTQAIDTGDDEYRMGWRDPDDMEWRPTHWRPLPKEPAQ